MKEPASDLWHGRAHAAVCVRGSGMRLVRARKRIVGQKAYVNTDVYICNMIISDASTLILLTRVSILRRSLSAFGKIIVPEEVAKEMTVAHSLDARMLEREIQEKVSSWKR